MDVFKTTVERIVKDIIATGDDFQDSYNEFNPITGGGDANLHHPLYFL